MEQTRDERARDLMRLGDLDGASKIAAAEIQQVGDQGNTTELWRFRFVRAQVLEAHGHVDQALKYLVSLAPPPPERRIVRRPQDVGLSRDCWAALRPRTGF